VQEGHGGEGKEIVVRLHEEVCESCPASLTVELLPDVRLDVERVGVSLLGTQLLLCQAERLEDRMLVGLP
jgi:hypothetical protein